MRAINMENRQSRRHTINVTASLLCNNHNYPAEILDISAGGAKVRLAGYNLEPDSKITIDLPFLNELAASVIWSNGSHCGVKFNDDQNKLNDFLYNLAIYGASHL